MPNPRKTRPADRKPRREALKPRVMHYNVGDESGFGVTLYERPEDSDRHNNSDDTKPVLVIDWSPAGQEWLAERLTDIIGSRKSSKEFAPFFRIVDLKEARAILRRMEELAKGEGRK